MIESKLCPSLAKVSPYLYYLLIFFIDYWENLLKITHRLIELV